MLEHGDKDWYDVCKSFVPKGLGGPPACFWQSGGGVGCWKKSPVRGSLRVIFKNFKGKAFSPLSQVSLDNPLRLWYASGRVCSGFRT